MQQSNPNLIVSPNPLHSCDQQNQNPMKTLLLSEKFTQNNLLDWPIKVNFNGWYKPHENWGNWVEKLSSKHAKTWEITGICDGILSSLNEIKLNSEIVLGLCEFWCSETNTFVFPWGEATITLEDVCILGGFSVIGESVHLSNWDYSSKVLEQRLYRVRRKMIMKSVDGSASYTKWLNHFNRVEYGDLEHVGFLAFWLSSFVFPGIDDSNVGKHVFQIAVNLARGVKIALAPAVLACLYDNLSFLTKNAVDFDCYKTGISVPGPFHIVLLWALERFPLLGSKLAKPLSLGHPRIARWDKVIPKITLVDVRSVLRTKDSFCARPYSLDLEHWRPRKVCLENGQIKPDCLDDDDDEVQSFRVFVQEQKLVGINYCTAMYFPERVAIQFECERDNAVKIAPSSSSESKHMNNLCSKPVTDNENVSRERDNAVKVAPSSSSESMHMNNLCSKPVTDNENVSRERDNAVKVAPSSSSESMHMNNLCSKPVTDNENAIRGTFEHKGIDGAKKPVLRVCDNMNSGSNAEVEILSASINKDGTEKNSCKVTSECLDDVVVLDSDEVMINKTGNKNSSRRSGKKVKRKFGDTADYPLYVADQIRRADSRVKRSGISIEHPIDVENYCHYSD